MTRNLSTDGETIWSYMVPVARRYQDGSVSIAPEMSRFWSRTTTSHLHLVEAVARMQGVEVRRP